MRWLQWSTADLARGLGGVEVHARSLARELGRLGVDVILSDDPADLRRDDWDVIHFHGSGYTRAARTRAIRVNTLHGTTLGRMRACREWAWPGGYAAWTREIQNVLAADIVLSVHPRLSLYRFAERLGKPTAVCWNGWDASDDRGAVPSELEARSDAGESRWLFVGRGDDFMKGADRVRAALARRPDLRIVAAPGTGFEGAARVYRTGRLSSAQVRELMLRSDGLLIPSRYEGHSLVVLEALAAGLIVVATPVGGVPDLPPVDGLEIVPNGNPNEILMALERSEKSGVFGRERKAARQAVNQAALPRWSAVARTTLDAVERFRAGKKGS